MIKITVDTKNGVQIVKKDAIVRGTLKDLLYELTALQSSLIDSIVEQNKENLQPGVDELTAKFNMIDTIAQTTKIAIESNHKYTSDTSTTVQHIKPLQEDSEDEAEEITVNDIIKGGLGIDMDNLTWEMYAMSVLIEKWWPVMNDHILSKEEMIQLRKEAKDAGIDMDDLLDAMIDKQSKEME